MTRRRPMIDMGYFDIMLSSREGQLVYYSLTKSRSVLRMALVRLGHCQSEYASTLNSTIYDCSAKKIPVLKFKNTLFSLNK